MAALEVQEALKLLHGLPVAAGTRAGVQRRRQPVLHDAAAISRRLPEPRDLSRSRWSSRWATTRRSPTSSPRPATARCDGPLTLALDRDLVVAIDCPRCGWRSEVMRPRTKVRHAEAICPNCREPGRPEVVSAVDGGLAPGRPAACRRWACRLTISSGSMAPSGSRFFLLAGDRAADLRGMGAEPVSGDEMVFEEIKYREPVRLLRPDRDRRYACLSYQVPGPGRPADLPRSPHGRRHGAARPQRHQRRAGRHPAGQGMRRRGRPATRSSGSRSRSRPSTTPTPRRASPTPTTPGKRSPASATSASPTSTSSAGTTPIPASASSCRTTTCSSTSISSPSRSRWPTSIDPIQQTRGFFQWRDRGMAQVEGFYLTADRGDRMALAKLANDLENLPSPQGQEAAILSPRLEAELIKMLTRPSAPQYVSSPVDRLQTAMIFAHARVVPGRARRGRRALALPAQRPGPGTERGAQGPGSLGRSGRSVTSGWPWTRCSRRREPTNRRVRSNATSARPGARPGHAAGRRPASRSTRRSATGRRSWNSWPRSWPPSSTTARQDPGKNRERRQGSARAAERISEMQKKKSSCSASSTRRRRSPTPLRQEGRGRAVQAQPVPDRDLHPRASRRCAGRGRRLSFMRSFDEPDRELPVARAETHHIT